MLAGDRLRASSGIATYARMRLAVASVMALLLGCEARHFDAAVAPGPADPTPPHPPPTSGPWVRDSTVPAGYGPSSAFHSPQAGDLWLEIRDNRSQQHLPLYHRSAGAWASVFEMDTHSPTKVWIRSPREAWILEFGGALHVVTPSGDAITDLSRTGRFYPAFAAGWIAYFEATGGNPSAHCQGIGFLRQTDSGFTDVPAPEACSAVSDIYGTAAVTLNGEVLFWDGSNWKIKNRLESGGLTYYGTLSGGGPNDLYLLGGTLHGLVTLGHHFDGAIWNRFQLDGSNLIVSFWARPSGPRWGLNRSDAFEWDDAGWHNRGPMPTTLAHEWGGASGIGSDGTDIFVTGEWVHPGGGEWVPPGSGVPGTIWVYRYAR